MTSPRSSRSTPAAPSARPGSAADAGVRLVPGAVVFDLGGVLIDWDPRHLYRSLFSDDRAMETFLAEICSPEWNAGLDAGRPMAQAVDELARRHPALREPILAYHRRWSEMLGGAIEGSVEILAELRRRGVAVYALSNWSAETYPLARARFDFLSWFDGVLISGEVGLVKPDSRIFRLFLERHRLAPAATAYIDDSPVNVQAARALGLRAIQFSGPPQLRRELTALGLLD